MNWWLFFAIFLIVPIGVGTLIGAKLSLDEQIPRYVPNARANRVILGLVLIGILYIALASDRSIKEPEVWITLGVFLAAACLNFAVMICHRIRLVSKQRREQS